MATQKPPAPHKGPGTRPRRAVSKYIWRLFLDQLRKGMSPRLAAERVNVPRMTLLTYRDKTEGRQKAFDAAYDEGTDLLEDHATKRAVEGVKKPILYKGKPVTDEQGNVLYETEYSDFLLDRQLRGRRPQKYRDRHEHVGKDGAPLEPAQQNVHLHFDAIDEKA